MSILFLFVITIFKAQFLLFIIIGLLSVSLYKDLLTNSPIIGRKRQLVVGWILIHIVTAFAVFAHGEIGSILVGGIFAIIGYGVTLICMRPDFRLEGEYEEFLLINAIGSILMLLVSISGISHWYLFQDQIRNYLVIGSPILIMTILYFSVRRIKFLVAIAVFSVLSLIKTYFSPYILIEDVLIISIFSIVAGYVIEWLHDTTFIERKIASNIGNSLLYALILFGGILIIFWK